MATMVHLGIAVMGAVGFAAVTARLRPRLRRVATAIVALAIASEGYGGALRVEAFPTDDMQADQPAYDWLRTQPRGPMLELPTRGTELAVRHLYRTLVHRNRIVNGYSGYGSALQNFVGGAPFTELAYMDDALRMARSLGLRWIVVHPPLYRDPASGAAISASMRDAGIHVTRVVNFETAVVVELRPLAVSPAPAIDPAWREVPPDSFIAWASHNAASVGRMFDGDQATRWFTGERQQGREWIALRFPASVDVAQVRLEMARRSFSDYPRGLLVEGSTDGLGWRPLFEGGVLPRLALSIAHEPGPPAIDVPLPRNDTCILRLRTAGETRQWYWSVHELRVWRR